MDKLEQYLDQVCRHIGGPRPLRQHVRQELREHLLDAVARHKAAGLAEGAALDKALEDFGKPEDVRSEMEAAHGQRLMAVVLDKALLWKEKTMKAKWLWTSWAYLSLVAVVALEVLFLTFNVMVIVPRFQKLMQDGYVDYATLEELEVTWMPAYLEGVQTVTGQYATPLVLLAAGAWGLFEWRVRSDNKSFMRVAALGTAAAGLMGVLMLLLGSLVICFTLAMPPLGQMARPFALEQINGVNTAVEAVEQALARKDWKAMQEPVKQADQALTRLGVGPAVTSLTTWKEPPGVAELRGHLKSAHEQFRAVRQSAQGEDAGRLAEELKRFRRAFQPLRDAATRPGVR